MMAYQKIMSVVALITCFSAFPSQGNATKGLDTTLFKDYQIQKSGRVKHNPSRQSLANAFGYQRLGEESISVSQKISFKHVSRAKKLPSWQKDRAKARIHRRKPTGLEHPAAIDSMRSRIITASSKLEPMEDFVIFFKHVSSKDKLSQKKQEIARKKLHERIPTGLEMCTAEIDHLHSRIMKQEAAKKKIHERIPTGLGKLTFTNSWLEDLDRPREAETEKRPHSPYFWDAVL